MHPSIAAAVTAAFAGVTVEAPRRGRNPKFPYVPVLRYPPAWPGAVARSSQILARAYGTKAEALAAGHAHLERARAAFAADLADPRHRALRQQHGLPREIADLPDPTDHN